MRAHDWPGPAAAGDASRHDGGGAQRGHETRLRATLLLVVVAGPRDRVTWVFAAMILVAPRGAIPADSAMVTR